MYRLHWSVSNYEERGMDSHGTEGGPAALVERLHVATNAHDLEAVVGCFATDYRNETPAHPERGFTGRDQVRRNWQQIFTALPDITTELLRCAVDGDTAWTEWEHRGTRADGSRHIMRGVVIFGVCQDVADWARFYLEPVQADGGNADAAVRRQLAPGGPR
jgi:ketosteroid isomerase-like protein